MSIRNTGDETTTESPSGFVRARLSRTLSSARSRCYSRRADWPESSFEEYKSAQLCLRESIALCNSSIWTLLAT
jgi:hypothetical protein